MSGSTDTTDCPRCGEKDTLQTYSDYKPFDMFSGECLRCGLVISTSCSLLSKKNLEKLGMSYGFKKRDWTPFNKKQKEAMKRFDTMWVNS